MATIQSLLDEGGELQAYAWPGGYPIVYQDGDGCTLCPECAQKHLEDEVETWRPVSGDVYYEGPSLWCEECNVEIPSAYGDPPPSTRC